MTRRDITLRGELAEEFEEYREAVEDEIGPVDRTMVVQLWIHRTEPGDLLADE